jgi:presenilin enhancer 2
MNLKKATSKERLEICRKYYIAGFFCLPFMWIVNFCWFFKYTFITPSTSTTTQNEDELKDRAQMKSCKN